MAFSPCCTEGNPFPHTNQLLNHIVDCVAAHRPQVLYAEYPVSPVSYDAGFRKITYGMLANAINRIAWWLHDNLGPGDGAETLAYIGPNDLTYPALILGAVKAGYKILLLSPRNPLPAQLHLLGVTSCTTFLAPNPRPLAVNSILGSPDHTLRVLQTPSVAELLEPRCRPYPFTKSLDEARYDTLVIMHTSGSTGLPKPISWNQDFTVRYAKQFQLEPPLGFESTDKLYEGNRAFIAYPPFHAAYVAHALVNAIVHQTAVFFPLSGAIPSAQSLSDALRHTKMDVAFVVPAFIEEMSTSPVLLDHISSNLEILIYTGGDVPQGCGDIVSSKIPIINFYGNTEGASLALVRQDGTPPGQEWKYLTFHPNSGAEFRPHSDNLYELCIVRKPELERHQQIFTTFPNQQEFKTKDLFIRHPVEPHLWSHRGRTDDIIVFLTGEKVNPVTVEQYIFSQHPEITGVIMVGSQRFQAALLLELAGDKTVDERATMIDEIWPSVEKANTDCPAYARITKSHVMFTDPQRPMSRSPKGTIQRKATLVEYQKDIDALYLAAETVSVTSNHIDPRTRVDVRNGEQLRSYLKNVVLKVCGQTVGDDENFFVWGMDSLQALLLTRELQHGLQLQGLTTRSVYQNPSIKLLAEALQFSSVDTGTTKPTDEAKGRLDVIDKALRDHQNLIDRIAVSPRSPPGHNDRSERVILLTGSTGFLGSYLLDALLASEATTHIYCLNRSSDSGKLQIERSRARGLSTEFPANRVSFLAADLSKEDFGLGPDIYGDLLHRVTVIVHNAWPVNFNIPLSSFWPQLMGVVNLIRFATVASHTPSLLYISSVSAVSNLGSVTTMPEEVVDDHDAPDHMGYGESKYLSERVLEYASRQLPSLRIQIARVGQVAGPVQGPGQWSTSEWLPSLVRSSLHIAAVPGSLGSGLSQINWIPVDVLAQVLVELVVSAVDGGDYNGVPHGSSEAAFRPEDQASHAGSCHVFNLLNPRPVSWQSILPAITSTLSTVRRLRKGHEEKKTVVETVSFDRWIEQIRQDMDTWMSSHAHDNNQQLETLFDVNPAVKLLDFYEAEARIQKPCNNWDTRRAERASATLREVEGIQGTWVEKWIGDWLM